MLMAVILYHGRGTAQQQINTITQELQAIILITQRQLIFISAQLWIQSAGHNIIIN